MGDILKAIKLIPQTILDWHDKQLEEENLMKKCEEVINSFNEMKTHNEKRDVEIAEIRDNLKDLKRQMGVVSFQLGATKEGIKKELGETIHQWYEKGMTQGWLAAAEKREVEEIFHIYSNELEGNGLGKHYYDAIMALPEREA